MAKFATNWVIFLKGPHTRPDGSGTSVARAPLSKEPNVKKHLVLLVIALVGIAFATQPAQARRATCKGIDATTWDSFSGAGDIRFVVGTDGNDVFVPSAIDHSGRLVIFGLDGDDLICGSHRADVIIAGPGNDIVFARGGADKVEGGTGNDMISGGRGGDRLFGNEGNDVLRGGGGRDQLSGGAGVDTILRGSRDTVLDGDENDTTDPTPPATPTPEDEPTPSATPTPKDEPTPSATPTPKSEPTPAPTSTPTPAPSATPTPGPTSTPAPTTPPVSGAFPGSHADSVSLIQGASATADQRNSIVWDRNERMSFPLAAGNPNEYTPSAQLDFDDYVEHYGSQYGADVGRGPTGGVFHVTCQFSHLAYDDPIVFPGQPGASHLHMFFGNTHANAYSTSDSILNQGGSTCSRGELNRTSYWIPAAFDSQANVLIPDQFMVYYESYDEEWDTLQPFPDGLRMVNGNGTATSLQEDIENFGSPVVNWKCGWYGTATLTGGGSATTFQETPPHCDASQYSHLEMHIRWPFCWDGVRLDSPNHQDHVVFPEAGQGYFVPGTCPASHPVTLPRITYRIHFATSTVSGSTSDILLSSDVSTNGSVTSSSVSGHGDWFGGWNRDLIEGLVQRCILTGEECSGTQYGTPGGEQAASTLLEARTISPEQVQEYCPIRTSWTGNLEDLAYCRE